MTDQNPIEMNQDRESDISIQANPKVIPFAYSE